ncbi:unnamed protein product [Closterium sp. NIES-54]
MVNPSWYGVALASILAQTLNKACGLRDMVNPLWFGVALASILAQTLNKVLRRSLIQAAHHSARIGAFTSFITTSSFIGDFSTLQRIRNTWALYQASSASSAIDGSPTSKFMAVISYGGPLAKDYPPWQGRHDLHRLPVFTLCYSSTILSHVDETPNDVNEGPPEDEHQPQPGAPAADTSDHPESRPEGSHAAPPTIISGQSNATPLNPLVLKLLHFVRRVNGGMGMVEVDINGLLQLVVEPGLAPLVISDLRNCKDLERFEMERLAGLNRGWSVATFEIDGHPPQRLLFQNSAQAFAEMFGHPNNAPGFKLKARVDEDPDAGSHRNTTPETGMWWNDAQKAWPLMMTLANISQAKRWGKAGHTLLALLPIPPSAMSAVEKVMLFQRCVITVLQPLLDGIARFVLGLHLAKTSSRHLHDQLHTLAWIADAVQHLLCCKGEVTCHLHAFKYILVCGSPDRTHIATTLTFSIPSLTPVLQQEHLSAVKARNTPRTPEQQQWIVNEAAGTTTSQADPCKVYSTYPVEWDVTGTAWGNPYLVVMPDIMHQADLGIMSHIVAVVRKMKKPRVKQMDRSVFWGLDSLLFVTFTQTISSPQGHTERSLRELKKMTSR